MSAQKIKKTRVLKRLLAYALSFAVSFGPGAPLTNALAAYGAAAPVVLAASGVNGEIEVKKSERSEIQGRLGDVRRQIGENEDENQRLGEEKRELDALKDESEAEYNDLVGLLRMYETMIYESDMALEEAERACDAQCELLKARVRSMYMNSDGSSIEALLSSKDLTSFMEKLELFSVISGHDDDVLNDFANARADVEYKRSLQVSVANRAGEMTVAQGLELDELNLSRQELEGRIQDLQAKVDKLLSQEDDLETQSLKLETEIKELVAKAEAEEAARVAAAKAAAEKAAKAAAAKEAAAKAAADKAAKEASAKTASQSAQASGKGPGGMTWPLPGYRTLSSSYGNRIHPIQKKKIFHSGIDIPAPTGTSIVAAKSGTVIISRVESGYGNTIVIDHGGGLTTLYGHCSKLIAKTGQKVQAGTTIAKVGSTGNSTGPHLHFEVRKNGSPVNPSGYV